ncbi:hypothetical protein L3X07_12495 [Levilactobacillus brevis]|nr:hypothetical protein [Levilactobacillus brevis]
MRLHQTLVLAGLSLLVLGLAGANHPHKRAPLALKTAVASPAAITAPPIPTPLSRPHHRLVPQKRKLIDLRLLKRSVPAT